MKENTDLVDLHEAGQKDQDGPALDGPTGLVVLRRQGEQVHERVDDELQVDRRLGLGRHDPHPHAAGRLGRRGAPENRKKREGRVRHIYIAR